MALSVTQEQEALGHKRPSVAAVVLCNPCPLGGGWSPDKRNLSEISLVIEDVQRQNEPQESSSW